MCELSLELHAGNLCFIVCTEEIIFFLFTCVFLLLKILYWETIDFFKMIDFELLVEISVLMFSETRRMLICDDVRPSNLFFWMCPS